MLKPRRKEEDEEIFSVKGKRKEAVATKGFFKKILIFLNFFSLHNRKIVRLPPTPLLSSFHDKILYGLP